VERLVRRTYVPNNTGGSTLGRPPTQFVALSTLGTERTEVFPYNLQNFWGRTLDTRRDMEEILKAIVQERTVEPSLDYTILKFGDIVPEDDGSSSSSSSSNMDTDQENAKTFSFQYGDVLDGTTSLDLAIEVMVQAMALQPAARNATLCVTGKLPPYHAMDERRRLYDWEDAFDKLVGPELVRYETMSNLPLNILEEYWKEWASLLTRSGQRYLTTPMDIVDVPTTPSSSSSILSKYDSNRCVIQERRSVHLWFRPTATGEYYLSKNEERELEERFGSKIPLGLQQQQQQGSRSRSRRRRDGEGGIELSMERTTRNTIRLRVLRTNMGPNTVIKVQSERTLISNIEKGWNQFWLQNPEMKWNTMK
jgi:hypothetical protein